MSVSVGFGPIFIREFSDYIYLQVEQKASITWPLFRHEVVRGQSISLPRLGKVNMSLRTGNNYSSASLSELPSSFRFMTMNIYDLIIPISNIDVERMNNDPTNYVAQRVASAIGRQIDQVVLQAILGSASTGQTGGGSAATLSQTVAVNDHTFDSADLVGTGNVGLTVGKLLNAQQQILTQKRPMGIPDGELDVFMSADQMAHIYTEPRFTNFFYNDKRPIETGGLPGILNMRFHVTMDIPNDSSGNNQVIVTDRNAIVIGSPNERPMIAIEPRYDLVGKVWQVKGELSVGAVRMEEELVVSISCLA